MTIWRQWPTEIEANLLPQADIYDWHAGTQDPHGWLKLSSRRLLALLEFLPETTAFKTAAERDGGYTETQLIAAQTHNELARLRASYHVVHGGEDAAYEPYEFVDPIIARIRAEKEEDEEREREEAYADIYTDMFGP